MSSSKGPDLADVWRDSCALLTGSAAVKIALNHLQCAGQLLQPVHKFASAAVYDHQQARSAAGKDNSEWILSGQVRLQQSPNNQQSSGVVPSNVTAARSSFSANEEMSDAAQPPGGRTAGTSTKMKTNCNGKQQEMTAAASPVAHNNPTGHKQLKPLKEALHDLHDIVAAMEQLCNPYLSADGECGGLGCCLPCTLTDKLQVEDAHTSEGLPLAKFRPSSAIETGGAINKNSSACNLQRQCHEIQLAPNRGRQMNMHLLRGRLHKLQDRLGNLETRMLMVAALQDTSSAGDRQRSGKGRRGSATQGVTSPLQHLPAAKGRQILKSTAGGVRQGALKPPVGAEAEARRTFASTETCVNVGIHPSCQSSVCHAGDETDHAEASQGKQQNLVIRMQREVDDMTRELDDMKRALPHVYGLITR
jgi:hypothetical protein